MVKNLPEPYTKHVFTPKFLLAVGVFLAQLALPGVAHADCAQYEQQAQQLLNSSKNGSSRGAVQAEFQKIVNAMQREGCGVELMDVMKMMQEQQGPAR